ncbi:D-alanyl-D-alanine carboxypeptidase/D-alanyl-D-alanine-endopeptidase [Gammaproteobacteria bacterium]|nr:D-alanyl-D-alanine carboxypeptidase/D-alanyl-D-alanine-endopeptidase [Gammaproteobacteria bacterium]
MTHSLLLKLSTIVILLFVAARSIASGSFPIKIEQALTHYQIDQNDVSLIVQAIDENEARLSLNPDALRNPASLAKLITSWVALKRLGPSYKWKTEFYTAGEIKDGVLHGDLVIKGYGDPYLTNQDLWSILGKLNRNGLKKITGQLLLDDTYFITDEIDPYAFDGDGTHIYNNLPNALTLNFNALDLTFSAKNNNTKITASYWPPIENIKLNNSVQLINGSCIGKMPNIKIDSITIENETHIKARGEMPLSCKDYSVSRNLMSRDRYFFNSFKMIWNQWGAQIDGNVGRTVLTKEHTLLYSHDSPALADVITAMNKWSNNQMARSLIYTLGVSPDGAHATRARGIKVITEELENYNIPKTALTIINGSGLSRNVRASGNAITQILRAAWNDKNASEFVSSLSILGYDGTAAKRSLSGTSKTTMRVKTGSLDDVSAIAGYIHQGNKVFTVVCIVNSFIMNDGIGKKFEDEVLNWASSLR